MWWFPSILTSLRVKMLTVISSIFNLALCSDLSLSSIFRTSAKSLCWPLSFSNPVDEIAMMIPAGPTSRSCCEEHMEKSMLLLRMCGCVHTCTHIHIHTHNWRCYNYFYWSLSFLLWWQEPVISFLLSSVFRKGRHSLDVNAMMKMKFTTPCPVDTILPLVPITAWGLLIRKPHSWSTSVTK